MPGGTRYRVLACVFAVACASPSLPPIDHQQRIERAETGLEDDPVLEAHRAAVEAAEAKEERPKLVDGVQLRFGDDYLASREQLDSEHQLTALARVKVRHPVELEAERNALRAETEIAVTRLEEASLERRAALCFPSVEALVHEQRDRIYGDFAERQQVLLEWSEDWRTSGMIDEVSATRFEIDSRVKLATRRPTPLAESKRVEMTLPELGSDAGELLRSPEHLREIVRGHHPSVGVLRATEQHYRRLAERADARRLPGLRFVDVGYEYRTDRSRSGVGGQLAFDVPFGGQARADMRRFEALGRQQHSEANALIEDQILLSLQALEQVHDFEARMDQWRELEQLAAKAELIADRWWKARLAMPDQVAALLDDAYEARIAVLEAREGAASAGCTLLGMTGVSLENWERRLEPRD